MTFARVGVQVVSVSIEEIEPSDWVDKVYRPDILNGSGKLYKKPGYNPVNSAGGREEAPLRPNGAKARLRL
jgi:hypothetical protein